MKRRIVPNPQLPSDWLQIANLGDQWVEFATFFPPNCLLSYTGWRFSFVQLRNQSAITVQLTNSGRTRNIPLMFLSFSSREEDDSYVQ